MPIEKVEFHEVVDALYEKLDPDFGGHRMWCCRMGAKDNVVYAIHRRVPVGYYDNSDKPDKEVKVTFYPRLQKVLLSIKGKKDKTVENTARCTGQKYLAKIVRTVQDLGKY